SNGHITGTTGPGGRVNPVPIINTRAMQTKVTVWDGQTAVLGGLVATSTNTMVSQVPLLGSLPLVGRLFRSQSSQPVRKQLLLFVTATIINPDGTCYHSDEEDKALWAGPPPPQGSTNR